MSSTNTKPAKRKVQSLLIYPKFQLSLIKAAVFSSGLVGASYLAANAYFFGRFHQVGKALGLPEDHAYFQFLLTQQKTMYWVLGTTSVLACGILCVGAIILSHRVAGPLIRLKRHMDAISEGAAPGPISFREGDYFEDLAESFNRQQARKTADPLTK
jgi:hypothetical protein